MPELTPSPTVAPSPTATATVPTRASTATVPTRAATATVPTRATMDPRRWRIILGILGATAALLRLVGLNTPTDGGLPIFDEKHYVPQSLQMLLSWDHWLIGGIEDNPSFGLVVHPPLGKQIEALGMALAGYTPWGWRLGAAVCSVLTVVLTAMIARRLARSDWVGLLAGILALCEGILFVTGRSGMLDAMQTVFIVAAGYALLRDHEQVNARFDYGRRELFLRRRVVGASSPFLADAGSAPWPSRLGPAVGMRWWRWGAGLALGCALSVKWSGLYYMAAAGVGLVLADVLRRHAFGVPRPVLGTLLRDTLWHFWAVVILPLIVYIFSWRAWFSGESSVFRHAVETERFEIPSWIPDGLPLAVQNFLYYHASVLKFHAELTNSNGHHHDWESKPWSWVLLLRGLMYYNPSSEDGIKRTVLLLGTPLIWWLCIPILAWGLWCLLSRRDLRWTLPLVGFAAGFIPWLFNLDRQMYLFYALPLAPCLIIALALGLGQLSTWQRPHAPAPDPGASRWRQAWGYVRRNPGIVLTIGYVCLVVWNFLFFLPIYGAIPLPVRDWVLRIWVPSWV